MNNQTVIDSRRKPERGRRGSFIYLILAVICALVLWLYVAGVDTDRAEKKFTDVSIKLENAQAMQDTLGFSVLSEYTQMDADITVSGKKSDINRLKVTDLTVWVDLNDVSVAGNNKLNVRIDMPDGLTVTACNPQSVTVYVDETTTKAVPVEAGSVNFKKDGELELIGPVFNRQTVNVTGPAGELEKVTRAVVDLDLGTVTDSVDVTGTIVLKDASGNPVDSPYIRTDVTQVTASYQAYVTKKVGLRVEFAQGFLSTADKSAAVTLSHDTLLLKGAPKVLETVQTITVLRLNETELAGTTLDATVSADSLVLPAGVEIAQADVLSDGIQVSVQIKNASRELHVPLAEPQLSVVLPEGMLVSFQQEQLALTLRGTPAGLQAVDPLSLRVSVDLSVYTTEGVKDKVPVTVSFTNGAQAYVVGEYTLGVTLTKAPAVQKSF